MNNIPFSYEKGMFALCLYNFHIMRDLDRIPQRGIHRAILLLADLDRLPDLFNLDAFADNLVMDVDLAEPPRRSLVLHRLRRNVELVQFLTLFPQDLDHIIRCASDQRHGQQIRWTDSLRFGQVDSIIAVIAQDELFFGIPV
jgi:hypothetical protein